MAAGDRKRSAVLPGANWGRGQPSTVYGVVL